MSDNMRINCKQNFKVMLWLSK